MRPAAARRNVSSVQESPRSYVPERRRRGRPLSLGLETVRLICSALSTGAYPDEAASAAGISRSTYYAWLARGRGARDSRDSDRPVEESDLPFLDLLDAVEQATTAAEIAALETIGRASSEGSWRAAAWFLERRYPEKWGPGRKVAAEVLDTKVAESRLPEVTVADLERRVATILSRKPVRG
jgi:transposase